jgi:hypothetical protein
MSLPMLTQFISRFGEISHIEVSATRLAEAAPCTLGKTKIGVCYHVKVLLQ